MGKNAAETMGWTPQAIGRRAFLIGGAGVGLGFPLLAAARARAALPGIPADGRIAFHVFRKGSHIGEHTMRFEQDGDDLTVRVDVRIVVKIGPLPVYRHTQHCTERWRGDQFLSLDSATTSTASNQKVTARRTSDGVQIEPAVGAPYTAPAATLPLTHWNRAVYQGPVFDPEKGKLLRDTLVSRADDMVKLADGSAIRATRYSTSGDAVEDIYYDSAGVWAGLKVKVQDGSSVEYLRV